MATKSARREAIIGARCMNILCVNKMDDISNVSHLKNAKSSITWRTPRGPLTKTLRSKHRKERQRYDTLCDQENRKMYLDNRTIQKRTNKKRKAYVIDESTTKNAPPKAGVMQKRSSKICKTLKSKRRRK
eukprot:544298_1